MSEIRVKEHASFIKTPKQLAIVVVLAFAVPIAVIVLLVQLVTSRPTGEGMSDEEIAKRLKPVGEVVVDATAPREAPPAEKPAEPVPPAAAPAPATPEKVAVAGGRAVYEATCTVCHAAGVAGAPRTGDKAAWAPRIQAGMDTLYAHSIKGFKAMPPKGGNLKLSDDEVKAAVDYMVERAK
jgi:cytochrome c5